MSKIIGNTTTTPVPRSDFLQNDETKANYILNRPTLGKISTKNVVERNDLSTDVQSHLLEIDTKANVLTVTTEEYDAIVEAGELNANTLYALTDDELTADEAIELLAEMNIIQPTTDENGALYVDENNAIYVI